MPTGLPALHLLNETDPVSSLWVTFLYERWADKNQTILQEFQPVAQQPSLDHLSMTEGLPSGYSALRPWNFFYLETCLFTTSGLLHTYYVPEGIWICT